MLIGISICICAALVVLGCLGCIVYIDHPRNLKEIYKKECEAPWEYVLTSLMLWPVIICLGVNWMLKGSKTYRWFFGITEKDNGND